MTPHEMLNTSYRLLMKQGRPSCDYRHHCRYRGPSKTACAVGVLIENDRLAKNLDRRVRSNIKLILTHNCPEELEWMKPHVDLLSAMQAVHDGADPEYFHADLTAGYRRIAERFDLTLEAGE